MHTDKKVQCRSSRGCAQTREIECNVFLVECSSCGFREIVGSSDSVPALRSKLRLDEMGDHIFSGKCIASIPLVDPPAGGNIDFGDFHKHFIRVE